MNPAGAGPRQVQRRRDGAIEDTTDIVAHEVPVALHYNGASFAVLMATPADLADLALGFSLSEGIVPAAEALRIDAIDESVDGVVVHMAIAETHASALAARSRSLPGYGGCGVCGSRDLETVLRSPPPVTSTLQVTEAALHAALRGLHACQPLNSATGAVHAAGFADADGTLRLVREDVGRHNALDKLIGALAQAAIHPGAGFAVVTSRASYELAMKSAQAGLPLLAAISAPTTLAIALAASTGLSLIGFARDGRCSVYAHPQRLLPAD